MKINSESNNWTVNRLTMSFDRAPDEGLTGERTLDK